jgi:hypothetical protein
MDAIARHPGWSNGEYRHDPGIDKVDEVGKKQGV